MKKASVLLPILLSTAFAGLVSSPVSLLPAGAEGSALSTDGKFEQSIKSAKFFEERGNKGEAARAYEQAAQAAGTDDERAKAWLGVGRNRALRYGDPDPATDGKYRFEAFGKVLELPGAKPADKAEANLGLAETYNALNRYPEALAALKKVIDEPGAEPKQKFRAYLQNGRTLTQTGAYPGARTSLTAALAVPDLSIAEKTVALQALATTYFREKKLQDGLAQIAKIDALPGLADADRADIYLLNGKLIQDDGYPSAARDEYARVAALVNAPVEKVMAARLQIGAAFYAEKDYVKARETWEQTLAMRGGEEQAGEILPLIAQSYLAEKNYDGARSAASRWIAAPGTQIPAKIQAWQFIANTHVEQKDYPKAREALTHFSEVLPANVSGDDKLQVKVRQDLDTADVYRMEKNFAKAAEIYVEVLATVPEPVAKGLSVPLFYYDARNAVKTAADEMAQNKDSMAAAYPVYEAWEKLYPYEKNKADAFLGMGDILAAQGRKTEAREKYQKAYDLRKNYDEGKLAKKKMDALG